LDKQVAASSEDLYLSLSHAGTGNEEVVRDSSVESRNIPLSLPLPGCSLSHNQREAPEKKGTLFFLTQMMKAVMMPQTHQRKEARKCFGNWKCRTRTR
jgi:hypothetical protein